MQFIKKYGFLIFTMVITIVGYFVLKFSVDLGASSASAYLDSVGGSLNSAEFHSIQSKYIISNMIAGGILLFLGVTFLFFAVYRLSENNS